MLRRAGVFLPRGKNTVRVGDSACSCFGGRQLAARGNRRQFAADLFMLRRAATPARVFMLRRAFAARGKNQDSACTIFLGGNERFLPDFEGHAKLEVSRAPRSTCACVVNAVASVCNLVIEKKKLLPSFLICKMAIKMNEIVFC